VSQIKIIGNREEKEKEEKVRPSF